MYYQRSQGRGDNRFPSNPNRRSFDNSGYYESYGGGNSGGGRGQKNYIISPPDKTLIWIIGALIVIGMMAIFSAGSPRAIAEGVNPVFFTIRQLIWLVAGLAGAAILARYDYKKLRAFTYQLPIIVLILLALVQFTPLGHTVNEAKRWLVLGPLQIQPSEFAKPAVILMFASLFANNPRLADEKKYPAYFICGFAFAYL